MTGQGRRPLTSCADAWATVAGVEWFHPTGGSRSWSPGASTAILTRAGPGRQRVSTQADG